MRHAKAKPSKLLYELIPEDTDIGRPMYAQLAALIRAHHEALDQAGARIALAWALSWKRDVDGNLVLGKCKKATALDRELAPYDFVILLNRDFWQNTRVSREQRQALLDHELMHAAVAHDTDGEPKVDAKGRTVYRIRRHDLEEFRDVVARHGCYKRDLEDFMAALHRAEARSGGAFVGYTRLSLTLKDVGVELEPRILATWTDAERREVMTWALLNADIGAKALTTSLTIPPILAAALHPPAATH